jgi:hypothetical protein
MAIILLALLPVPPKFASKKSLARETLQQKNADVLKSVFELIFKPLQAVADLGIDIQCADGKVRRCFPVLAAWVADHLENITLHGIGSQRCPKCEVTADHLGTDSRQLFPLRNYERYKEVTEEYMRTGDERLVDSLEQVGVKINRNVFEGLSRVQISLLHMPDLLHNIYLGLFKHLMEWIGDFLKKHTREEMFDQVWKSLPTYPGFFVPKKAYREVTQWQGKEMRNLARCILGVLASALRRPTPAERGPFQKAILCVKALVDFSLIAQYRSHTLKTLEYMQGYLDDFYQYKDIFLEFRTSKRTRAGAEANNDIIRQAQTQQLREEGRMTSNKRRRIMESNRMEREEERIAYLRSQSHFNFIKMHLLVHFPSHVLQFGNIQMYSTDIGELAHKDQIKEGYRHSNRNDAACQILKYYGRIHSINMRVQTLASLVKNLESSSVPAELDKFLTECRLDLSSSQSEAQTPRRRLRGMHLKVNSLKDLCSNLEVPVDTMVQRLVKYSRKNLGITTSISEEMEQLCLFPVEQFTQLEIPILTFQETDCYDMHRARCTGKCPFRNGGNRNDWVWVAVGMEDQYGVLRGHLPGRLMGLFKLRNIPKRTVHRLAIVQLLQAHDGGKIKEVHGLVKVSNRHRGAADTRVSSVNNPNFEVVDIGTISGIAHLIPEEDGCWLVNSRIDLRTFNLIY